MKQAHEFGLTPKQKLACFVLNMTGMPALGLEIAQGSSVATPFYWDFNDATRAFAKRYQEKHPKKMMPNDMHAGMYASTAHLLKAYAQLKSADDGKALVDAMKAMPTDDPLFGKGKIREDGRHLHPVYLMAVKSPAESKGPWDAFKLVSTIGPEDAFRPLERGPLPVHQGLIGFPGPRLSRRAGSEPAVPGSLRTAAPKAAVELCRLTSAKSAPTLKKPLTLRLARVRAMPRLPGAQNRR